MARDLTRRPERRTVPGLGSRQAGWLAGIKIPSRRQVLRYACRALTRTRRFRPRDAAHTGTRLLPGRRRGATEEGIHPAHAVPP
jgi:hypothetical protein